MSSRLPGPERRQLVLDAALQTFGVGGYTAASMAEIARAAGVTKPVVYQHFASKRALFLEVLHDCGRQMTEQIEKATIDAGGPREQVAQGFAAFVRFFDDNPAMFRTMFSDANRSDPEFAAELHRIELGVAERIAALIDIDGLPDAERRMMAHGIVGLAEAACRHWMSGTSGLSAERTAEVLSELTWAGLRGSRRHS